jgi:intracellular sulfur oxidation DsrE/DsrF family protein
MRRPTNTPALATAAGLLMLLFATLSYAHNDELPINDDKPFAEEFIILQLSEREAAKQDTVLNVAANLIKHYGSSDVVDIEIIAFGPGIDLLVAGNPREDRIASLVDYGVRFIGCMNTVDTIERTTGERPELNEHTIPVQTGVAHIVERVRQGFVLVRP